MDEEHRSIYANPMDPEAWEKDEPFTLTAEQSARLDDGWGPSELEITPEEPARKMIGRVLAGNTLSILRTAITDPGAGYSRPIDADIVEAIDIVLNEWQDEEEACE